MKVGVGMLTLHSVQAGETTEFSSQLSDLEQTTPVPQIAMCVNGNMLYHPTEVF